AVKLYRPAGIRRRLSSPSTAPSSPQNTGRTPLQVRRPPTPSPTSRPDLSPPRRAGSPPPLTSFASPLPSAAMLLGAKVVPRDKQGGGEEEEMGCDGMRASEVVSKEMEGVRAIVLKPSESLDESRFTKIAGADFNDAGLGLDGLLGSLASTGFQASNLGDAIDVVNQMIGACRMRSQARTVMKLNLTRNTENLSGARYFLVSLQTLFLPVYGMLYGF
uniref:Uncharacterized protein n=1 Tax=Aegilops tauschii subsp. strangulata TaxID=200361 RepID=A0A453DTZ7_AEGTS